MPPIAFDAELEAAMEGKGWTFVALPKEASAQLGKKGRVPIEGTINGHPFRTSAFPDGEGSHHLAVNAGMRKGARVDQGDTAHFVIEPATDDVETQVPDELTDALDLDDAALAQWHAITPKARAEWVTWVTSAKQEATRDRRIVQTVERLRAGKRRPSS